MPRADDFTARHIGSTPEQISLMLDRLGLDSLDDLIEQTIPEQIRTRRDLSLPRSLDENLLNQQSRMIAAENFIAISMIGMGYYGTVTPTVIRRNVMENPDWYTAYTPYQPEISQARLEILIAFQQMVMDLTGMDLANASLLDEATAAAEAMQVARRVNRSKSNRFFVDRNIFPQTLAVIRTRAEPLGIEVVTGDCRTELSDGAFFAALMQYPAGDGEVRDYTSEIEQLHEQDALAILAADPLALTLLKPPGEMGADVVIGSTQRFGVPMGFGGPHAAYMATHDKYKRSIPGRLIGTTIDANGNLAYRMALQTREQHIRRDKATSNICTSQVLLAIMATVYAMYHGPQGLHRIASGVNRLTRALATELAHLGFEIVHENYFDTIKVRIPGRAKRLVDKAEQARYNLRLFDEDHIGISLDETISREKVVGLLEVFEGITTGQVRGNLFDIDLAVSIPEPLARTSEYLTHPIFHRFRSETEFMRYLRRTASKDITLARSMIPLGSCTMKLNAASEMEPISNPNFAHLHPFAPSKHARGFHRCITSLEKMLCEITGFDSFSFQPNAGSQGEYAGLLCIRAWHRSNGNPDRNVCLIPSSAHGTNPASAIMAEMKVVVVRCDANGNIDVDDFRNKAQEHREVLSATMVTYPSTHGVFEESIMDLCQIVHDNGGQVYMDGANMNAMVGFCRPAEIGADVMHLNLHKTFAIPHGGGGPGMGPIGVRKHLRPFLPDHPVISCNQGGSSPIGTVSSAPWGSPLILPISWAYLRLLGKHGLKRATQIAILNANYIAHRLDPHYPVVYKGSQGRVAHECVVNLAPIREASGVTVDDVAKRLIDYGFHAPTVSWPVPDSMMIEPTESESLDELDRFCDAMIQIREEIAEIEAGKTALENSLLTNAPHAYYLLAMENWDRPYSRERAFFPTRETWTNKFWPSVGRVDNVYGDRNVVCSCPPMSEYE
ncbi:MAG: aminomethyl-transferring glycine dehydrogenase [Gammaproteobacteria bacterium]|nr:aminomethyl-transferring glycine dehydrogenase [Gammaproteobacteria bacterium]MYJ51427.1 aminomethyl-transferring glycine dehydrogenase [Gammaproteobacteria bacterium]